MKTVFEQTEPRNLKLKNRLFRSATWDGLAKPDGALTEEIYDIYRELAEGGVGAIVTGLMDVSPYDLALAGNMRLYSDALIPDYQRLTNIVKSGDCRILAQINMNNYVRSSEKRSAQIDINDMTLNDISDIVRLFAQASARAEKAGFDGVQIHLAYGWLLNRFINPIYNHRDDAYGGAPENRARIISEIIAAIKEISPSLHISTKFSFYDKEDGSIEIDDCVKICGFLSEKGIDSIEVLGSHSLKENDPRQEACYLDLALAVTRKVRTPVILTGNNHDIQNMERLLNETAVKYFAMSRPLIREPDLPKIWLGGDKSKARCISCGKCYQTYGKRCVFSK